MYINRLLINDFRNLQYVELQPSPSFNFICGPNGSGKTSIIEAIHYLALARSFRTNSYQYLIRNGQRQFNLFAAVQEDDSMMASTIGLSRERGDSAIIKINSDPINRLVDLIDHICVQIIHPQGVDLITKEAEGRRGFIDWGVYYSDSEFKQLWMQYRKILKQRNALLRRAATQQKNGQSFSTGYGSSYSSGYSTDYSPSYSMGYVASSLDLDQIGVWDEALASLSEQITQKRIAYLESLQVILQEILGEFLPDFKLKFELNFGWEKGLDLRALLAQNLEKDKALGYTLYGCHRADLKIKNHNLLAGATLSRGQLKMLVYAMRLAQGLLLKEQTGRTCIYLIDDLNSELDDHSQSVLLKHLLACNHQVFISNIQQALFISEERSDFKVFQLDRGMVQEAQTSS